MTSAELIDEYDHKKRMFESYEQKLVVRLNRELVCKWTSPFSLMVVRNLKLMIREYQARTRIKDRQLAKELDLDANYLFRFLNRRWNPNPIKLKGVFVTFAAMLVSEGVTFDDAPERPYKGYCLHCAAVMWPHDHQFCLRCVQTVENCECDDKTRHSKEKKHYGHYYRKAKND